MLYTRHLKLGSLLNLMKYTFEKQQMAMLDRNPEPASEIEITACPAELQ